MKILAFWVALLSVSPTAAADELRLQHAPVTRYALPNGLRVVLQPDPRDADVVVLVSYEVGQRDDPPGHRGLAHLTEHMAYRGSRHVPDGKAVELVEEAGGLANAETTLERTMFYSVVPPGLLSQVLWIESDRMAFAVEAMTEEAVEVERDVVVQEMRQRLGEHGDVIPALLRERIYPAQHPYRLPRWQPDDLEDLELEDVQWFMAQHYRPEHATLVITGNFNPDMASVLIERYFAEVRQRGSRAPRAETPAVRFAGSEVVDIEGGVSDSTVVVRWHVVEPDATTRHALDVLQVAAAHTSESIMVRELSKLPEMKTVSFHVEHHPHHSAVVLTVTLRAQANLADAVKEVGRLMARLQDRGLSARDLATAKYVVVHNLLRQDEALPARAAALADGGDGLPQVIAGVMAVTMADVVRVAREELSSSRRLVVRMQGGEDWHREARVVDAMGALGARSVPASTRSQEAP